MEVWGLTNTGQLVQQTMLDNSTALQGNANPQVLTAPLHVTLLSCSFCSGQAYRLFEIYCKGEREKDCVSIAIPI